MRSVLDEQQARLIGGHTLEARSAAPQPAELGLQLSLASTVAAMAPHGGRGNPTGDALLLSRPLGTGVLFAAAMTGAARPQRSTMPA